MNTIKIIKGVGFVITVASFGLFFNVDWKLGLASFLLMIGSNMLMVNEEE
jgi:hypothetical protein